MSDIKKINGGVCAPEGFLAGATGCGIKAGEVTRDDIAVVFSEAPSHSAATFTTNNVKAAPVLVSASHLKAGRNRAVILNSGNANACTGEGGLRNAKAMAAATASDGDDFPAVVFCPSAAHTVRRTAQHRTMCDL